MAYPGFEPGPLAQKLDVLTTVLSGHLHKILERTLLEDERKGNYGLDGLQKGYGTEMGP
jgi:hypothetical protein